MLSTNYFPEFLDALRLHSDMVDNMNYEIMRNRFVAAIKKIKDIDSSRLRNKDE